MSREQTQMVVATKKDIPVLAQELGKLVMAYSAAELEKLNPIPRAFALAEGIQQIRDIVLRVAPVAIMPLQGSPLGFRTDKDGTGGYSVEVVAECATEALLRGYELVGNQWNIIGSRFYSTKEGLHARVTKIPGLTDLVIVPGIPKIGQTGAIVQMAATWKLDGKPMNIDREIPVRVNTGQIVDAIIGKAKRKLLAAIYELLTGSQLTDADSDGGEGASGGVHFAPPPPPPPPPAAATPPPAPATPAPAPPPGTPLTAREQIFAAIDEAETSAQLLAVAPRVGNDAEVRAAFERKTVELVKAGV